MCPSRLKFFGYHFIVPALDFFLEDIVIALGHMIVGGFLAIHALARTIQVGHSVCQVIVGCPNAPL